MCVILSLFAWGVYRKIQLDSGSSEFAISTLQPILVAGDSELLKSRAHTELLDAMAIDDLDYYLEVNLRLLGALQSIVSITGETDTPMISLPGSIVSANYIIEFEMENAPGQAILDLRYEDSRWLVTNFDFESQALMQ